MVEPSSTICEYRFPMTADSNTIKNIPNNKPVRAFLPLADKNDRYRASCVFEQTEPPKFNLLFKPGELPVDLVDQKETCLISIDMGGPNLSIQANILNIANDQTLNMILQKSISYQQMREFFRVDATTSVISSSFHPEFYDTDTKSWSLKGRTIDISGSGILAAFTEKPPKDKRVRLAITLPSKEPETISISAYPVRIEQIDNNLYEVAYHFDDIATEDRDKIIGCCLVIQRRLLRMKVQVKDTTRI